MNLGASSEGILLTNFLRDSVSPAKIYAGISSSKKISISSSIVFIEKSWDSIHFLRISGSSKVKKVFVSAISCLMVVLYNSNIAALMFIVCSNIIPQKF